MANDPKSVDPVPAYHPLVNLDPHVLHEATPPAEQPRLLANAQRELGGIAPRQGGHCWLADRGRGAAVAGMAPWAGGRPLGRELQDPGRREAAIIGHGTSANMAHAPAPFTLAPERLCTAGLIRTDVLAWRDPWQALQILRGQNGLPRWPAIWPGTFIHDLCQRGGCQVLGEPRHRRAVCCFLVKAESCSLPAVEMAGCGLGTR